jgi:hypothetical protein
MLKNKHQNSLRTSVTFYFERPSLYVPDIWIFFISNIRHFLFRSSVTLYSEHPVFFIPNISTAFISDILKNDFMLYIGFRTSSHLSRCPEEQGRKGTHPPFLIFHTIMLYAVTNYSLAVICFFFSFVYKLVFCL